MKRLRWYDYITVNLFWLGLNIRNNAVGNVLTPYLVALFVAPEVKNSALGGIRTAGLLVAMLIQPLAGLLSDRSTSRYGRRRPFILVGVLLDLVFLAAIGLAWGYGPLLVATLLIQFSANLSHGALQGLLPDLVPEEQRGRAAGVKAIFELLPLILIALTVAKLVSNKHVGWAIVATGGGLLLTMLLTMLLVHEQPLTEKPTDPLKPQMLRVLGILLGIAGGAVAGLAGGAVIGGLVGLAAWPFAGWEAGKAVAISVGGLVAMAIAVVVGVWAGALGALGQEARQRAGFTWWVVNRLMFFAAVTSIQAYAMYALMHAFGITIEAATSLNANLILAVGVATMLTALPGGWLADRFGHRTLVGVAGVVAALATGVLLVGLVLPNLTIIFVAGIILGLGTGLFVTSNWALGTDLVPPQEAGRYLGISNLAGAGAGMIGAGIGGPMADYLNRYHAGLGYLVIFGCYGVLFVLSTLVLKKVRRS